MPFDENLDQKISDAVAPFSMTRKKMFGGTCYVENGKMVCGVWNKFMILRLGQDESARVMKSPDVKVFDITGKPMKGWVMVGHQHLDDGTIKNWIGKARKFVATIEK